jgi:hypothetical protein
VVLCGLPGVGKTTLADEVSALMGAIVLSTDKIRKELFKRPTYSRNERKLVYDVMLLFAKYLHDAGKLCILDATFSRQRSRDQLKQVLGLKEEHLFIVQCVCPEEIVISRLTVRKDMYSDADVQVYKKMKKIFEPVLGEHITVDTSKSPKDNAVFIIDKIRKMS